MINIYTINKKIRDTLIFILIFFSIWGPTININVPLIRETNYLPIILGYFILIYYLIFKKLRINKLILQLFFLFLLNLTYATIIVALNDFKDTFIFLRNGRILFAYIGYLGIITMIINIYKENSINFLLKTIYFIGVMHSLIMWGMVFNDSFRQLVQRIVLYEGFGEGLEFLDRLRVSGLTARGGDTLSLTQGAEAILFPFIIKNEKGIKKLLYYISFLFLFSSTFLSARVGFVLTISIFFLYFIINKIEKRTIKIKSVLNFINYFIILLLIIIFIYMIIPSDVKDLLFKNYNSPIYRLMEPIRNFRENSKFSTKSTEALFTEHIFIPNNYITFIFGNSNMGRGDNFEYIPSDIGYIRMLYAIGIVGSFIFYFSYFWAYIYILRLNVDFKYKILIFLLSIYILIGHFKVMYASSQNIFAIYIFIIAIVSLSNKYSKIKSNKVKNL